MQRLTTSAEILCYVVVHIGGIVISFFVYPIILGFLVASLGLRSGSPAAMGFSFAVIYLVWSLLLMVVVMCLFFVLRNSFTPNGKSVPHDKRIF